MATRQWFAGIAIVAALAFSAWVGDAAAAVYRVGSGCTYASVQAAINALPAGTHEIRIRSGTYDNQAIKIASKNVTLRGGYADCTETTPIGSATLLSGAGGASDSVITITGASNDVILRNLGITQGDEVQDGNGGGIDFNGSGNLVTEDVAITFNYAGYGGGICFTATAASTLTLGRNTQVVLNTAQYSGGGIRVEGPATLVATAENIWIASNEARGLNPNNGNPTYGYGGGVLLFNGAKADIASSGYGTSAVISGNSARYGGGLAIIAGEDADTEARLFSMDASRPVRITNNTASQTGGGIYLKPDAAGLISDSNRTYFCALDFGSMSGNVAQEGAAIYGDSEFGISWIGSNVSINPVGRCDSPANAVACALGVTCNEISGNRAETTAGAATGGATILIQTEGYLNANRLSLRGNTGGSVLRIFGGGTENWGGGGGSLYNLLVADNTTTNALIRAGSADYDYLEIDSATIAGNTIGGANVIESSTDYFKLHRSIVWQPGKTVLLLTNGSREIGNVVAHEVTSLGGATANVMTTTDPLFLDPARTDYPTRGDYRPHAASPAVDFAASAGAGQLPTDIAGASRPNDLTLVPNRFGPYDIGAYERTDTAPLVRNGEFEQNLRLWTNGTWNESNNAVGGSGSGSLGLSASLAPGARGPTATQCVRVPGPGLYRLNGWVLTPRVVNGSGRGIIGWRFWPNAACTGTPTASAEPLFASSTSWIALGPTYIDVPTAQWTRNSHIEIQLILERPSGSLTTTVSSYFDGIDLQPGDDTIFRHGFE